MARSTWMNSSSLRLWCCLRPTTVEKGRLSVVGDCGWTGRARGFQDGDAHRLLRVGPVEEESGNLAGGVGVCILVVVFLGGVEQKA
jgi:hypothetical protein